MKVQKVYLLQQSKNLGNPNQECLLRHSQSNKVQKAEFICHKNNLTENVMFLLVINSMQHNARAGVNIVNWPLHVIVLYCVYYSWLTMYVHLRLRIMVPSMMIKCCFIRGWDTDRGEEEGEVWCPSFLSSLVVQSLQNSSGLSIAPLTYLTSFSDCSASGTVVHMKRKTRSRQW